MLLAAYSSAAVATTTPLLHLLCLLLLLHSPHLSATSFYHSNRRSLHQPLVLSTPISLPPAQPPSISPHYYHHHHSPNSPNPKLPFSSTTTSPPPAASTTDDGINPFFPTLTSPPPPPPPPAPTSIPTFPANISSLALPSTATSPSSQSSHPGKLAAIIILVTVSVLAIAFFAVFLRRRKRSPTPELKPLYPSDAPTSDGRPPLKQYSNTHVSHTSSEFLYLGTVAENCEFQQVQPTIPLEGTSLPPSEERVYHLKLCGGSPELKPLPPLPKHSFHLYSGEAHFVVEDEDVDEEHIKGEEFVVDEEFFSPSTSSHHGNNVDEDNYFNGSMLKSSCFSSSSCHGDSSPGRDSEVSIEIQALAEKKEWFPAPVPPPPPPKGKSWAGSGSGSGSGPPPLLPPSGPIVMKRSGPLGKSRSGERSEDGMKPKLKALYWDKVRASSDRVMVWDQLHPGSFQLNEEMIETLFTAKGPAKDGTRRSMVSLLNEEYRVIDPKKSQNIAILLKALSVTEKEVCEALLEGNADSLGTELLESLLKMAPTYEEERKLMEYKDESPMKLGQAEKFLRAMLDVPFAFKRVDAMLYMATFDSEVEYLRRSFETLEGACEQLRNNRMFLKLLEAVLKTGNRMNVGTNRGDALAFKLDTLLKLIDIKGTDGKTTLLHFVVQEIIKAEGSRPTDTNQPAVNNDIELRKRGLEVVASLGSELMSVKKAAAMDSDALVMEVSKLAQGITKISNVLRLSEESRMLETNKRITESMNEFLKKAEVEILRVQSQGNNTFSRVKDLTHYYHGNSAKEEAHPFRIFMVVRDFLGVLDQVCKEVGKINERTIISSFRPAPSSINPTLQPPFPGLSTAEEGISSDNDSVTPT